jgi:radical SAM-linked protein
MPDHFDNGQPIEPLTTVEMTFRKDGPARWLGHLDVMRAFHRAMRRTGIPIALTQGHNPRPRMRFVFPAAVGLSSYADVVFADLLCGPEDVNLAALNAGMPDGLAVDAARQIAAETRKDALLRYTVAEYRLSCSGGPALTREALDRACEDLMGATESVRRREARPGAHGRAAKGANRDGKNVDLRPYLSAVRGHMRDDGKGEIVALVRFGNQGTARPAELAELILARLPGAALEAIVRTRLLRHDT